jgi:hypothetical protein
MYPGGRPLDGKLLPNGEIVWTVFDGREFPYTFRKLDGTVTRTLSMVNAPTDLHDLRPLDNGNFMLMAYQPREHVDLSAYGGPSDAKVIDAEVQELTPTGALVWSWNSKDHIDRAETGRWYDEWVLAHPAVLPDGTSAYDLVHMNSLEPDGDGVIMSMRHTDGVYRVRRSDGAIDWKIGGTHTDESLTVENDRYGSYPLGGQHDARVTAGGAISIHDNGSGLHREPRGIRYRIDRALRTATLIEDVADPRAPSSFCCGSARRQSGGNWVFSWGSTPFVTELTPAGSPVLTIRFDEPVFSYRAATVEPGVVDASALRAGMDAMHPR